MIIAKLLLCGVLIWNLQFVLALFCLFGHTFLCWKDYTHRKKYFFQTENLFKDHSPRNYNFERRPIYNIQITVHGTNTVNFKGN